MEDNKKNIFEKEEKDLFPAKVNKAKRGVVANITTKRITIEYHGTGESIPFDASKHANLKIGDPIEF